MNADSNHPEYGVVLRHIPSGRLVRVKRTIISSELPAFEIFFADGTTGIVPSRNLDPHFSSEQLAEFERECVPDARF